MRPVIVVALAAAVVIAAFVAGGLFQESQDSPLENLAEDVEEQIQQ